jgi:hypothetical protein
VRKDVCGVVSSASIIFNATEVSQSTHTAQKGLPHEGGSPFWAVWVDALPLCGNAICHANLRLAVKMPLSPERLHLFCKSGIFPTPPYGLRGFAQSVAF